MMRGLTLFALFALSGCALTIYRAEWSRGGGGLTDAQWAEVDEAALAWCQATDGECCPIVSLYLSTGRIIRGVSLREARAHTQRPYPVGYYRRCAYELAGVCRPEIGLVTERLGTSDARYVAMHEFGHHCAGSSHSDDPAGVMYRDVNGAQALTATDIQWYRRYRP